MNHDQFMALLMSGLFVFSVGLGAFCFVRECQNGKVKEKGR